MQVKIYTDGAARGNPMRARIFIQQLRYRMRKLLLFTPFSATRFAMQEI